MADVSKADIQYSRDGKTEHSVILVFTQLNIFIYLINYLKKLPV